MVSTTTALELVRAALDEARALRSPVLGQEHVLLAIGERPASLGGEVFAALGVEPASMRTGLLAMIRPGADTFTGEPVPTPRVLRALEEADAEAVEHGRPTTSADLVLGILRTHQGVGFQLLGYAGIGEEALRRALEGALPGHPELDELIEQDAVDALG